MLSRNIRFSVLDSTTGSVLGTSNPVLSESPNRWIAPWTGSHRPQSAEVLQHVVRQTHQRPLLPDSLDASAQELPEPAALLDLPEHRLGQLHPFRIDLPTFLGSKLAGHALTHR